LPTVCVNEHFTVGLRYGAGVVNRFCKPDISSCKFQ
jgi:hypothetical protein